MRDFYAWLFYCDNPVTWLWFRMRHPILAAEVMTRIRILDSDGGYLDA